MKITVDELNYLIDQEAGRRINARLRPEADARVETFLQATPLAKEIEDLTAQRDALQGDVNELGVRVFQLQELEKLIHPKVNAQQVIDNAAKQVSRVLEVLGDEAPMITALLTAEETWKTPLERLAKWHEHVLREARILASILGED